MTQTLNLLNILLICDLFIYIGIQAIGEKMECHGQNF